MEDVFQFAGVMMTLLMTGLIGYGGLVFINRMKHNRPLTGLNPDEVDWVRTQIGERDDLRHRVVELEERLDFAERMLAERRDPALEPGKGD
ncbi:MAG: hypothetical protein R2882_08720 [Gemmatimonadales bacterium]